MMDAKATHTLLAEAIQRAALMGPEKFFEVTGLDANAFDDVCRELASPPHSYSQLAIVQSSIQIGFILAQMVAE
jgi:hypothetical protein